MRLLLGLLFLCLPQAQQDPQQERAHARFASFFMQMVHLPVASASMVAL